MISEPPVRDDVTTIAVPVNEIADRLGQARVGNMVMLGALIESGCGVSREAVLTALPGIVSSRPELTALNVRAIEAGEAVVRGESVSSS